MTSEFRRTARFMLFSVAGATCGAVFGAAASAITDNRSIMKGLVEGGCAGLVAGATGIQKDGLSFNAKGIAVFVAGGSLINLAIEAGFEPAMIQFLSAASGYALSRYISLKVPSL